jgi:hypothetical protein
MTRIVPREYRSVSAHAPMSSRWSWNRANISRSAATARRFSSSKTALIWGLWRLADAKRRSALTAPPPFPSASPRLCWPLICPPDTTRVLFATATE